MQVFSSPVLCICIPFILEALSKDSVFGILGYSPERLPSICDRYENPLYTLSQIFRFYPYNRRNGTSVLTEVRT